MAKSISAIQKEALREGFLDQFSRNRSNYLEAGDAPITEYLIAEAASNFILQAVENLNRLGKTDTGELEKSLSRGEIIKIGQSSYEVSLGYPSDSKAAKYYDYVDKGVQGWQSATKAPNSPYKYGKPKPRKKTLGDVATSSPMVEALKGWAKRQNLAFQAEDQKQGLNARQRKRKGVAKSVQEIGLDRFAYFAARKIKREGLETTRYFSGAVEDFFGKEFAQAVAKTIAADIRIYIRQVQR
jgi:hypothetical protein